MNIYEYTDNPDLKILRFPELSEEWLDFIAACRSGVSHDYDNVGTARYEVPGCWDVGKVFERLIEDVSDEPGMVDGIRKVYSSWIADRILNFNSDLYYQPRTYLAECYRTGEVIDA